MQFDYETEAIVAMFLAPVPLLPTNAGLPGSADGFLTFQYVDTSDWDLFATFTASAY